MTSTRSRPIPDLGPGRRSRSSRSAGPHESRNVTRQLVVIGAGGHGRELADIVRSCATSDPLIELLGIVDDDTPDRLLLARSGLRHLGSTEAIARRPDVEVWIGVGSPAMRARLDARYGQQAGEALRHPTVSIGTVTQLGPGVVLAPGSNVTTNVRLGRHSHVGTGSTVSHDVMVGDHVTICPGATVTGAVTIGDRVFVGAGATVLPGVSIGDDAIIGAGAVVTVDVEPGATVAGVPARRLF